MYEASQIDCSKDSVTNMKILFEMCPFSLTKTSMYVLFYVRHVIFASRLVRKRIVNSDGVKDPKPRNPRGTTSTFKSPTRTRPRKLIPEQNPKPDIQTPKPRKSPKVLNLYIKYLKNTIKINNKSLEKFFFKIYYIFFFPSTFKSQKNNANIFVEFLTTSAYEWS